MRRQQIIETIECDQCGGEVDAADAVGYTVEIGRAGMHGGATIRRTIDLCPADVRPVAELHELLRRISPNGDSGRSAPKRTPTRCPACDDEVMDIYLASHIGRKHKVEVRQPPQCPDCDTAIASRQGMLVHRRNFHNYDHVAALLATLPKAERAR